MRVAGGQREIFTADAIAAIGKYSSGLPRLINTICDNALLEGFLMKSEISLIRLMQSVIPRRQ